MGLQESRLAARAGFYTFSVEGAARPSSRRRPDSASGWVSDLPFVWPPSSAEESDTRSHIQAPVFGALLGGSVAGWCANLRACRRAVHTLPSLRCQTLPTCVRVRLCSAVVSLGEETAALVCETTPPTFTAPCTCGNVKLALRPGILEARG